MENTLVPGRVDIVIFANGGWEKIGQIASDPDIPFDDFLPEILQFVGTKQNLPAPEKFTGYYSAKDGDISIHWANYAGEIARTEEPVPTREDIEMRIAEAREMASSGGVQDE